MSAQLNFIDSQARMNMQQVVNQFTSNIKKTKSPRAVSPQKEGGQPSVFNSLELTSKLRKSSYNSLIGSFLTFFGAAYKVQDKKESFYISKKKLANVVLAPQLRDAALKTDRISQRILETLNPIMGEKILAVDIGNLSEQLKQEKNAEGIIKRIETIKDGSLEKLTMDFETLKQKLQPGDILLKKYHEDNKNIISTMQKAFRWMIFGNKEREAYKFTHAAMYIGDGKIAEAVTKGPQVRQLFLNDKLFGLLPKNQYWVIRPQDRTLGEEAAKVFKSFSKEVEPSPEEEKPELKYNFLEAARSLWHNSSFGYFARQRFLKYHADYKDGVVPTQIISPRDLFCSYAVSLAYQVADGTSKRDGRSLEDIVGDPNTQEKKGLWRAIKRGAWSRYQAIKNRKPINEFVRMKFDALRTDPQDLRNFVLRHPEHFKDRYVIQG